MSDIKKYLSEQFFKILRQVAAEQKFSDRINRTIGRIEKQCRKCEKFTPANAENIEKFYSLPPGGFDGFEKKCPGTGIRFDTEPTLQELQQCCKLATR